MHSCTSSVDQSIRVRHLVVLVTSAGSSLRQAPTFPAALYPFDADIPSIPKRLAMPKI